MNFSSSFFKDIFDVFKVFIEFVTTLFLFKIFLFFWPQGMWHLNSLTRGWTHIFCIGRWSLFSFKLNLFFFIFGYAGSLSLCGLFSNCGEQGLHSCCRVQALGCVGFHSCGSWDQGSVAQGIFLDVSRTGRQILYHWATRETREGEVVTVRLPWKSLSSFYKKINHIRLGPCQFTMHGWWFNH